ncbi:MAG: DHH family phosphoesterase [Synergistaceae bacterium]|nr:DHH family phosphoesterase [Synergistaceae bacterium]
MIPSCLEERLRVWEPDDSIRGVAREANCSVFTASLLSMRGVKPGMPAAEARRWIKPELEYWMEQMDIGNGSAAAARMWSSVSKESSIVVYGDYDVDGISATTFMLELALLKGARVRYYIPHRYNLGYGFHQGVVKTIAESGCKCDLLVVVDCGTQNIEAVGTAQKYGIPVLIFDHHLARGELASADALINPHVDGNELAKKLCAAGVVWSWAWKNELAPREWLVRNLDLPALATIADCVPMSSPVNRAIVREGLNVMKNCTRPGLRALMRGVELESQSLDADTLSMRVIPCLNAAGRLDIADRSMKIFFPKKEIEEDVQYLIDLNRRRRDMSAKILCDVEKCRSEAGGDHVMFGEDWPAGVLSSVASQVCCSRDTPVVLAAPAHPNMIRGTLRVPPGVDAEAILSSISGDLASWGGHRMAAGFSVSVEKWRGVSEKLEDMLSKAERVTEKEDILRWSPGKLSLDSWREAETLGPFGVDNPYPKLYCSHSGGICAEPLGRKGNHVKIFVDGGELLGFSAEHLLKENRAPSGWVYRPRVNFWRNCESLQLILEKVVMNVA